MTQTPVMWPVKKLKEIAVHRMGGTPSTRCEKYWNNGDVLWVTPSDLGRNEVIKVRDTARKITRAGLAAKHVEAYPPGTVLLSTTATIGNLGIADQPTYCNQQITAIIPNEKISSEYLAYYLLRSKTDLMRLGGTSTATHINQKNLATLCIPVPPLKEQCRIVDILSRAEGIARLRREAQKKTREIIPALFLDMFGDPVRNPNEWSTQLLGSVGKLDRGKSRHRPRDARELYGGPYPFIQTGDVANCGGRIKQYNATYSEIGLAQSKLWPAGTLCITIAANIAKTGVLEFDSCFPDSMVGFLPGDQIKTEYVQAWLGFLRPMLETRAPQAAQKNINLGILRGLPVPIPPLNLQKSFEQRCQDIFSIQAQQALALEKAEATLDALLAQYFGKTE